MAAQAGRFSQYCYWCGTDLGAVFPTEDRAVCERRECDRGARAASRAANDLKVREYERRCGADDY